MSEPQEESGSAGPPSRPDEPLRVHDVVGAQVRVVARRGYVVQGTCLDVWPLRGGGVAMKIKPVDGSAPRDVTTMEPITVLPPMEQQR